MVLVGLCVSGRVGLAVEGLGQVQQAAAGPFAELVVGFNQIPRLLAREYLAICNRTFSLVSFIETFVEVAHGHVEGLSKQPET